MEKHQVWLKPGWPLATIFIILSYAVFGHTLHFPFFVFDDGAFILANEEVRNLSFSSFFHFWINSKIPIPYNLWQITYAIFGETPGAFRFLNIMFHGFTSYMIFRVLYILTSEENREKYGFIILGVSFYFLIHPLSVETVVWISSLKGILSLFFALLSYENYIKIKGLSDKESTKPIILSVVFYALSLLSKPVSAVFPVIFIITDIFILKKNIKEKWGLFVYYFSLTIALSLLHVEGIEDDLFQYIKWNERLFIAGNAIIFYLSKALLPFKLHVIYPETILDVLKTMSGKAKFMIPVFNLSIFCFLIAFWTKKEFQKISAGILFFFLMIMPVSGIIPFEFQKLSYVADRYAYHALFGLSFALLFLIIEIVKRYPRLHNILKLGAIAFSLMLFFKNFSYSSKWVKNSRILAKSYENATNNTYLGIAYANTKTAEYDLEGAMSILQRIYSRDPNYNESLSSIVETFSFRCDPQRTHKILSLFDLSDSSLPLETLLNKAHLHISVGELEKAFTILLYIESSHMKLSDTASSLLQNIKLDIERTEAKSFLNLGYLNFRRYKFKEALKYFEEGLDISKDKNDIESFNVWIGLAREKLLESKN